MNVDGGLISFSTSSRSTTYQYAARAVLHEGLQVTLNYFPTYMCYYYVLVTPTFDLGFRLEKRNAGKNFRKWRAVSRANAALWGHKIYLGFRVEKKLS